ncbi:glycoside hydrolase family 32 protein [Aeromonas eucrenophila]|uniref:Sucrose-6-phosphate hydrolase n=1 Tax=Aeromonas eucrenophila TaxID=649 RepID=A0ABW0Y7K2_9GAMM|nr:glycoside hydrolase family 32 protein [Aeromonas eucrenophila]
MTPALSQANGAILAKKDDINPRWYPSYHLAPQAGWMNDPNGLSWFDGYYHAFYQHYPHAPVWGPMHWGHARSRDMVNWEHLPIVLAPEGAEDKDGCYSGSAVVDGDQLALIYTGHKFHGQPCDDNLFQVQCLATSRDGVSFQREGMVLDTPLGVHHFRDPKVWREGEQWFMVVGARVDDIGEVQLYRSDDLRQWEYAGVIGRADADMGYMWECPDFFPLGDQRVLMFSPQGMAAKGYANRNLFQSGYMTGQWQIGGEFNVEQPFQEMDHGHDFYAPQSFETPDGRRIVIGWLAMWESPMPEQADGWAGMLSLPRELSLSAQGKLRMNPVKELESLRGEPRPWSVSELKDQAVTVETHAEAMEVCLEWDLSQSRAETFGLRLGKGASIHVDSQSQRLVLERDYPEFGLCGYRSVPLPAGDILSLRIFIDRSSIEVFVNAGEYSLSSRIYPAMDDRQLTLFSQHGQALVHQAQAWVLAD